MSKLFLSSSGIAAISRRPALLRPPLVDHHLQRPVSMMASDANQGSRVADTRIKVASSNWATRCCPSIAVKPRKIGNLWCTTTTCVLTGVTGDPFSCAMCISALTLHPPTRPSFTIIPGIGDQFRDTVEVYGCPSTRPWLHHRFVISIKRRPGQHRITTVHVRLHVSITVAFSRATL